jgi:hypothetical protein
VHRPVNALAIRIGRGTPSVSRAFAGPRTESRCACAPPMSQHELPMSWMNDPKEAAKHPWRSAAFVFVSLALFWTVFAYFRFTHRAALTAILVGLVFGLGGALAMLRWARDPEGFTERARGRRVGIDTMATGAGVGIGLFGASSGNLAVASAGLPLLALGLGWYLVKRYAPRR